MFCLFLYVILFSKLHLRFFNFNEIRHFFLLFSDISLSLGALTGGLVSADRETILHVAKEILKLWGSCKTSVEFIAKFLLKDALAFGRETLKNSDILVEFFKHADLITTYAAELCGDFKVTSQKGDSFVFFVLFVNISLTYVFVF